MESLIKSLLGRNRKNDTPVAGGDAGPAAVTPVRFQWEHKGNNCYVQR